MPDQLECQTVSNLLIEVKKSIAALSSKMEEAIEDKSFSTLMKEEQFDYDVDKYNFAELVMECFDCPSLCLLHLGTIGQKVYEIEELTKETESSSRGFINKEWKTFNKSKFMDVYDNFIKNVIHQIMCSNPDEELYYQAEPSFRFHIPKGKCDRNLIRKHCDLEYFHQKKEINFWIPMSENCKGQNSLFVESSPGLGDFHSFDVHYGSFKKFYGNQCMHYVTQNTTEFSRVSFDFRVIRKRDYNPFAEESLNKEGKNRFQPEEYYSICRGRT